MKKITDFIVEKRLFVLLFFIVITCFCLYISKNVQINYNMTKYLPKTSQTRIGLDIMDEEFTEEESSSLKVMFKDLKDNEKEEIYNRLKKLDNVETVEYEFDSKKYNKNAYTLYILNINESNDSKEATKLYKEVNEKFKDYDFYLGGNIFERNLKIVPPWISVLAVTIVALILIIMCESYIEPFLFLMCIGMAVLTNNGTNVIFSSVSNITKSIAAILQLALSMDYSIMLINRYRQENEKNKDKVEAMKEALYKSFSAISSSSVTTVVGLITLVFMSFTIGKDIGLILAKGVILSLTVILTCLPALILLFDKLIEKTKKKTPNINLKTVACIIHKVRYAGLILLVVLFVASYILKGDLSIVYTPEENDIIGSVFRNDNQMAMVYKNEDEEKVSKLLEKIEKEKNCKEVLGYGNTIGQKLKYNEFNDKLESLNIDTSIDEELLQLVYYNYYSENKEISMTYNEFVKFIKLKVIENETFNKHVDQDIRENIDKLEIFSDNEQISKNISSSEIASILSLNESDVKNLLIYNYKDKLNPSLTIEEFIRFINNDVLTNSTYSSSIDAATREDLKTLSKFTNKETINKKLNYQEMAHLFNMDEESIYKLYLYYFSINGVGEEYSLSELGFFLANYLIAEDNYENYLSDDAIEVIRLIKKIGKKENVDKEMTIEELSDVLNIDEQIIRDVLLEKYKKTSDGTSLTLKELSSYIYQNPSLIESDNLQQLNNISVFINNYENIDETPLAKEELSNLFDNIAPQLVENIYQALEIDKDKKISPKDLIEKALNDLRESLDEETITKLQNLKTIIDKSINNEEISSTEMANLLGIDEDVMNLIYALHNYINKNTAFWKESIYNLIEALLNEETQQETIDKLTSTTREMLQRFSIIIKSLKEDRKYSYPELSRLLGINEETTRNIYTLYSSTREENQPTPLVFVNFILEHKNDELLKNNLDDNLISKLELLRKVMQSTNENRLYTSSDMSSLLGLRKDDTKLLYSLYASTYLNASMNISLREFVGFLLSDVVTNERFSNNFNNETISKLKGIEKIMDDTINGRKNTSKEVYNTLSSIANSIEENTIDLVYIYYGSKNYYKERWTLSIESFVNYVNDKILSDKKYDDFIDKDLRKTIKDSKKTIEDNKKRLVGKKYSRVVLNTRFDLEGEDTYNFLETLENDLKSTTSYLVGDSPMSYELSKTFKNEFNYISILTMIAIFIVVAITFKSLLTPLVLVLVIQCAVYLTMGIMSIMGSDVYFIALLIVQSILMGATIDYAIVYTSYYIESRGKYDIKESIKTAYNRSIHTILTSSSILLIATFLVGEFSTGIVSMLCKTLSGGVLCSTILILFILPATLAAIDKFVIKRMHKNETNI